MKTWIARHFLLLSVGLSVAMFEHARRTAWSLELALLLSTGLILLSGVLIERRLPYLRSWNEAGSDRRTDRHSAVVLIGVIDPLLKYSVPLAVLAVYGVLPSGAALWLDHTTPFWAQVLAATLLIELGKYASHRWHHNDRRLWWLHALHHSSERLYLLNNFRFHPLNYLINTALSLLPVMLLGAPAHVMAGYLAITQPVVILQHLNADLRSGWLNYVLSTNELHRWHHANSPQEANHNFGAAIVLWDQIFGSFKYDRLHNEPLRIGLFGDNQNYPAQASYAQQLLSMFKPGCCNPT